MAEARCRQQWDHTSFLLAMIHNAVPGMKKAHLKKPSHFNPYVKQEEDDGDLEISFDSLKLLIGAAAAPVIGSKIEPTPDF